MALERTIRIKVDASKAGTKIDKLDRKTEKLGTTAKKTRAQFGALKASVIAVGAALQVAVVARYSDAWKGVNNSLSTSLTATQSLSKAQADVVRIAEDARSPLAAVAKLYGGIAAASTELGASQDDIAAFTELASKAIAVQGSTAGESAGALLQLKQAIGGTVIQAQEFNSLIDGARPLLEAIANGSDRFGGSVNKLREEVRKGTVTSKEFFEAALKGSEIIEKRYGKAVVTLAASFTLAENAAIKFIGENEAINSVMKSTGETVVDLANNLDSLVTVLLATASVYGSKLLASLITSTAAKVTATASTISLAKAEQSAAASALASANAEKAATAARLGSSSSKLNAAVASGILAKAENAVVVAATRAAAANTAMAISTRALSASLAFLGGPLGVLLIAVSALVLFGRGESDAEIKAKEFSKTIDDQIDSVKGLDTELKLATASKKAFAQQNDLIAQIQAQKMVLDELEKSALAAATSYNQFGLATTLSKIPEAKDKLKELNAQLSKVSLLTTEIFNKEQGGDGKIKTIDKVKEEPIFVNTEKFKTESLKAELAKRLEINRAFNDIMIQDFQTQQDKERAIIDFNKQADLADLEKDITDSNLGFQQKQEVLDANQKLSGANRLSIQLELDAQQDAQEDLHNLERLQIEQDFELAKTEITRVGEKERAELMAQAAFVAQNANRQSFDMIMGFMNQFAGNSKKIAVALIAVAAAEGASRVMIDTQAGAMRAVAQLGAFAAPAVAAIEARGAIALGIIGANAALKIGAATSSGGSGGGSFSGGGSSSQPAQRQEPVNQSTVVDFRGLEGIAETLANFDPDELLPVEVTQRLIASIQAVKRFSGDEE